jgi:hypothetical protein
MYILQKAFLSIHFFKSARYGFYVFHCPQTCPNYQPSTCRVVGGLWVRLGKIKCAAKALARVSACSSFNFAKRWHFSVRF